MPFTDGFGDGVSGSLWDMEWRGNAAGVGEFDGHLNFSTNPTFDWGWAGYVSRGWRLDTGQDFALKVDWHITLWSAAKAYVELGIRDHDSFEIAIRAGNVVSNRFTEVAWSVDGEPDSSMVSRDVTDGKFYISYDASSDKLYLSLNGYWRPTDPSKGDWAFTDVKADWGPAAQVCIGFWASYPNYDPWAEAYLDNFRVQTGALVGPPSAATNVKASNGAYTGKVRVKWGAVSGADKYRVYRAKSATGTKTAVSTWRVKTGYSDKTAQPGIKYYYWVKAKNAHGKSPYSAYDAGWVRLPAPTNVRASDGTDPRYVRVKWDAVSGADEYCVYRAKSATGSKTAICKWRTATVYKDKSAKAGVKYYYWVRARNALGKSGYSAYDTGRRAG